ncbi:MAG: hypothetical protein IJS54_02630 [Desulfovibrio sp.]|nr:hypothetical protein [Desulfovibrio sp.]
MSWHALAVHLTLQSDIHCGDFPLGFVARTHPYVPCHIPFFALVPPAVALLGMRDVHASYKEVEELFSHCLRSTPFLIEEERVLFPWVSEDLQVIESSYLNARYGVMLTDSTRSAKDGCLYETEVIAATKRASMCPTRLAGALFVRAHTSKNLSIKEDGSLVSSTKTVPLAQLLARMRLGGDRTRALGLPAKAESAPLGKSLWGMEVDCTNTWPKLLVPKNTPGAFPLAMEGVENIEGRPMMFTGRRYTERGAGLGMDKAQAAYMPGWIRRNHPTPIALQAPRYATLCASQDEA